MNKIGLPILLLLFVCTACRLSGVVLSPLTGGAPRPTGVNYSQFALVEEIGFGTPLGISLGPRDENLILVTHSGIYIFSLPEGNLIFNLKGNPETGLHSSGVIEWAPDKSMVAIGKEDNGVWILDSKTWALLDEREGCRRWACGDGGYSRGITWSPDSKKLALSSVDGRIYVWDANNRSWETVETPYDSHLGILWDKAEGLLVMQQAANFGLTSIESGELVYPIERGGVDGLAETFFSPNRKLAYVIFDLGGGVIDISTGSYVHGTCCYNYFAWSADSKEFAYTTNWDQTQLTINIWSAETSQEVELHPPVDSNGPLAWSSDGSLVALVRQQGRLVLWNASNNTPFAELQLPLAIFPNEARTLVSSRYRLEIWNSESEEIEAGIEISESTRQVVSTTDLKKVAIQHDDCSLSIWHNNVLTASGRLLPAETCFMRFSPLLNYVLITSGENPVLVDLRDWSTKHFDLESNSFTFKAAWNPDETQLAIFDFDAIYVYSLPQGDFLFDLSEGVGGYSGDGFSWSPSGEFFAYVNNDGTARLYDAQSGDLLHFYTLNREYQYSVVWSPNSKLFAMGTVRNRPHGLTYIANTKGGQLQSIDTGPIFALAFSPDGRVLATADNQQIFLWETSTGDLVHTWIAENRAVSELRWSHDGNHLYSRGSEGVIRVWGVPD